MNMLAAGDGYCGRIGREHGEHGVENCNEVWPVGEKLEFLSLEHRFGRTVVVLWCRILEFLSTETVGSLLFFFPGWCFSFPSPTSVEVSPC